MKVRLKLYYYATNPMDQQLHIIVEPVIGAYAKGSEVHYVDYPSYNATFGGYVSGSTVDRFKRGVWFEFEKSGHISSFDMNLFLMNLSSILIFLTFAEVCVGLIAFSLLGYTSKIYSSASDEAVDSDEVIETLAVGTAVAASSFSVMTRALELQSEGEGSMIQKVHMDKLFMDSGLTEEERTPLIEALFDGPELTFQKFLEKMSGEGKLNYKDIGAVSSNVTALEKLAHKAKEIFMDPTKGAKIAPVDGPQGAEMAKK